MNGIFIPDEIKTLKTINLAEKVLLSIYWYYTNGKLKCCKKTNEDIYNELMVSKNTFHRMKTHLKELGYIRTDGGIRVYYLGVENKITESYTEEQITEEVVEPVIDEVEEPTETDIEPVEEVEEKAEEKVNKTEITENEEVVEEDIVKPDIVKPDIVKQVETDTFMEQDNKTNFDKLVEQLPDEFKHEEMVKYLMSEKSENIEYINSVDFSKLNTKMYITQFKTIISDNFNVYGGSEEEETDLKKEFFSPENEMTENETDKELLDWISNLTLEPKVEYGKV